MDEKTKKEYKTRFIDSVGPNGLLGDYRELWVTTSQQNKSYEDQMGTYANVDPNAAEGDERGSFPAPDEAIESAP